MPDATIAALRATIDQQADTIERIKKLVRWLVRLIGALVVVMIAMGLSAYLGYFRVRDKVDDLQNGNTPASISARQNRAEQSFRVCSNSLAAAELQGRREAADVKRSCRGYTTLAGAYRTEHVPPRIP